MSDLGDTILKKDWNCFKEWFARKEEYLFAILFFVSSVVPFGMGVWGLLALDSWWLFVVGAVASYGVLIPVVWLLNKVNRL